MYWRGYRGDAIFREDDHAGAVTRRVGDQAACDRIDLTQVFRYPRVVGAITLQIVIEVREVNEGQCRRSRPAHIKRSIRNPARTRDGTRRSPELEQRESAQLPG